MFICQTNLWILKIYSIYPKIKYKYYKQISSLFLLLEFYAVYLTDNIFNSKVILNKFKTFISIPKRINIYSWVVLL